MPEEIVENAEATESEAQRVGDSDDSGAQDDSSQDQGTDRAVKMERELERLRKELSGRDRKIAEMQKERMTEEERRQAELEETKSLILEERTQRIKAENRAAARDMLTEAGIARVPRILDELVKDDPEATRDAVGKYIEERKEERAEWAKEYARQNGRTVSGPREDSPDNKLPELTPEQMRRLPPDVRATYSA